ncbi:MAG: tyrosine-type recombinase/integrase [Nitrosopumilaceae archaeon]
MQVIQSKETIEQSFYDSLFVMSHSTKTISTYKTGINHFRKFLKEKQIKDELELANHLKENEDLTFQILREFVVYLDKKKIKARGLRSYLSGVKGYLRIIGVKINSDDFKSLVKIPKIVRTKEIPITKEIILRLLHVSSQKLQTVILVLVASGMRLGELVQLTLDDIDFNSNLTKITIRANSTKGRMTRETFLTIEATNTLKNYLKRYFNWREDVRNEHLHGVPIFWRISKTKKISIDQAKFDPLIAKQNLEVSLRLHIQKNPDLNIKNENGLNAIHFHAFRKYFRTVVGNVCGRDYAEALIGHQFYMDTYYQLSDEKKYEMYQKAEPYLTISDFKTVEENLKTFYERQIELERKLNELTSYLTKNSIPIPETLL